MTMINNKYAVQNVDEWDNCDVMQYGAPTIKNRLKKLADDAAETHRYTGKSRMKWHGESADDTGMRVEFINMFDPEFIAEWVLDDFLDEFVEAHEEQYEAFKRIKREMLLREL